MFADASTAFRFPAMAMGGLALWVTYLFGARAYSRRAGAWPRCSWADAARLLQRAPGLLRRAHHGDVDLVHVRVLALADQTGGSGGRSRGGIVYGLTLDDQARRLEAAGAHRPARALRPVARAHRQASDRPLRAAGRAARHGHAGAASSGTRSGPGCGTTRVPRLQEWFAFHLNHVYYNMEFSTRSTSRLPRRAGTCR